MWHNAAAANKQKVAGPILQRFYDNDAKEHGETVERLQREGHLSKPIGDGGNNCDAHPVYTEIAFAERLVRLNHESLRFCHQRGWLVWTGSHWKADDMGRPQALAKETVRAAYGDLAVIADKSDRDLAYKAIRQMENSNRVGGILKLAQSESLIRISVSELDRHPFLLNCGNGVLDLKTCEFREHRRQNHITKCTGVTYDPKATAPRWERFLREVFDENDELISFMQRAAG